MDSKLAIIGGSGAYDLLKRNNLGRELSLRTLTTPFGKSAPLHTFELDKLRFLFLSRHGEDRYALSAPFVNYRANVWALKECGVERIISWSGPGVMNPEIQVGQFIVPHDLIDETRNRDYTFFENSGIGFIRQSSPFCREIRDCSMESLKTLNKNFRDQGVYVCTQGPRLETVSEIKKYRSFGGDLVGMTLIPETFLARELEMCYAAICYATNYAEGVAERPYESGKLFEGMANTSEKKLVDDSVLSFPEIIIKTMELLAQRKERGSHCRCHEAMWRYKKEETISEDWRSWIKPK